PEVAVGAASAGTTGEGAGPESGRSAPPDAPVPPAGDGDARAGAGRACAGAGGGVVFAGPPAVFHAAVAAAGNEGAVRAFRRARRGGGRPAGRRPVLAACAVPPRDVGEGMAGRSRRNGFAAPFHRAGGNGSGAVCRGADGEPGRLS